MSGEESGADCFSDLSCCEEKFHACERRYQCLEAAENLESMTAASGKAGVPFKVFVVWGLERWGLSGRALREMRAAHSRARNREETVMTEEEGCWNCKYDELGPDEDPCSSCVSYDPILSKWERGEQGK